MLLDLGVCDQSRSQPVRSRVDFRAQNISPDLWVEKNLNKKESIGKPTLQDLFDRLESSLEKVHIELYQIISAACLTEYLDAYLQIWPTHTSSLA